jgi:hypothetical protein
VFHVQSIEEIPNLLVNVWGIDLVVAQVILSSSVILAIVLPILIIRKDGKFGVEIIAASFGMFICIGLGWLPLWVMIVSLIMTAVGASSLISAKVGG